MEKPLVSIITPVYKVEPYIHKYLYSVLNQTYHELEVICINDGSPDNCGEILEAYAAKDSRLRVLHQTNEGVAGATNAGLDIIHGDYVSFVDPDDWIELDYYMDMVEIAKKTNAEIVISNFFRENQYTCKLMVNHSEVPECFSDRNSAFRFGFESDVYPGFKMFLWNKLFNSKFFTCEEAGGHKFRMNKSRTYTGGDVGLTANCFLTSKMFAYTSKPHYHYRIREDSLVRAAIFEHRVGLNFALEEIAKKLECENFSTETINLVKRFHTYYCSQLAEFAYQIDDKENLAFSKKQIQKFLSEYIASNAVYPNRLERIEKILKLRLENAK